MTALRATDALVAGALKLGASALVLAGGFRAVSDDDYARIVIAQRFAEAPSLDPSGTSWLPAPFWIYGAGFAMFGPGLGVARAVALMLGVGATLLVLVAARWLGANRFGALAAALVSATLPWSVWLGAAALPEAPVAGLAVLGMAALSCNDVPRRALGAVAVGLACLSRYEAWPVAAVFAAFTLADARRSGSVAVETAELGARARRFTVPGPWILGATAVLATVPSLLWLLHGLVRHGDALFFWTRVASYKRALGDETAGFERAFEPFLALVGEEPVLTVALVLALVVRARSGVERPFAPYMRGVACSLALLSFLAIGALGGGAPTHHAARALLPVWLFAAIVAGHAAGHWLERRPLAAQLATGALVATLLALAAHPAVRPSDFARRELELEIGREARHAGAPALLVDTPDFGYFAVSAAFGRPTRSEPLVERDPRKPRPSDPFESEGTLRARLAARPGAWLVAARTHERLARDSGSVRFENAMFVLVAPR